MTNCPPGSHIESTTPLASLLAAHGIADVQGLEMLRLVRTVNGAYEHVLAAQADSTPLTPHRWRVLFRIWLEEEQGCAAVHPTQLSRVHQVSKNTISEHLRALEDAGFIVRSLDEEDRRQFKIRLTPAGRDLVHRAMPGYVQLLNQLLTGLSDDERAQLARLLVKLQQTVYAYGAYAIEEK